MIPETPETPVKKIKIIEAVNQLGLGGTEYALQLYAKFLDKNLFDVTVVSLIKGGQRVKMIEDMGLKVIVLDGDFTRLGPLLAQADVLHWHGSGACETDPEFFEVLKSHKPPLVLQTNVFGAFDNSPMYQLIDYDLYISKMILIRRMKQDKALKNNFKEKRKVLAYPVDIDHINNFTPDDAQVALFKRENKIDNCFITGRIGRADNNKFDLITLDGFAAFARNVEQARFLLVGATPEMILHAGQLGITDKLLVLENTADLNKLLLYYKTLDIFLAASNIGESFGMVIAEAMTVGTPVITISTEDRDNAQIELIDNMESGIVVKRDANAIAAAITYLFNNKKAVQKIANASRDKVAKNYKAQNIVKSLEQLILKHFKLPLDHYPYEETLVQNFSNELVNDYAARCANLFGKPGIIQRLSAVFRKI